jgi:putative membrane protein
MKINRLSRPGAAALVAAALFCSAYAADSLSHSDRSFMEKAAKSGMKEVDISQAVQARVTDPQVKSAAEMMISDHTAANKELMDLAAKKGVTLPADDMKASEKWSKKDKDLDDDYIEEMKDDHEDAVKLFEKAAKSDDPDIAAFATKTLPTLQHHLTMIKDIKKAR